MAKKKMFGQRAHPWPTLQKLVEQKVLLPIDLAYAETQTLDETEAATHAALLAAIRQGHLQLKKEVLDPTLAAMIEEGASLPKYAHFEQQIVTHIHRLLSYPPNEKKEILNQQLTDEQNNALKNACKYPLSLITGGPGTGKTYTATQIAHSLNTETILTAPTGKAAAHLESKVNIPARSGTLHALLRVRNPLDYTKNSETLDAKLIIVDECSMIDPLLFGRLLSAIGPNTTLILMGDCNQLPAVEGGSIFSDLIASEKIPTTTLTKCMRSDRKEILDLAAAILNGSIQDIRTIDLGFSSIELETIYSKLWNHVKDRDFDHFRILSTLRKGPLGVDAINAYLFEKFSQQTDTFPIMIKCNDARTGLANGDVGTLIRDTEAIFPNDYRLPLHDLPPYEYAYCISVHKSQGSEYDHVLFLVPNGSEAFGREVLYTAVTRAKITLEIDGNPLQIAAALGRTSGKISGIRDKLAQ